jgi:NAD-dependent dihydropyrimidine dehydrogenase PreA subunit
MMSSAGAIYCHCASNATVAKERAAALANLCASGETIDAVGDLCAMAAADIEAARGYISNRVLDLACAPRAFRSLRTWIARGRETGVDAVPRAALRVALIRSGEDGWDPRRQGAIAAALLEADFPVSIRRVGYDPIPSAETLLVLGRFGEDLPETPAASAYYRDVAGMEPHEVVAVAQQVAQDAKVPIPAAGHGWFPLIDSDRCSDCRQCVSFCLFDVYGITDSHVAVQSPRNCKDQCPACARICPSGAIVFPKHPDPAINGHGKPAPPVASEQLTDKDVYAALRKRSSRPECDCLERIAEQLDIPPGVLDSLRGRR